MFFIISLYSSILAYIFHGTFLISLYSSALIYFFLKTFFISLYSSVSLTYSLGLSSLLSIPRLSFTSSLGPSSFPSIPQLSLTSSTSCDILYPIELCSYLNSNFSFHISSTLLSNVVFFSAACTYDYSDAAPNNNTDTPSTRYAHKHTLKLPTPLHGTEHEEKQSYWLNS